MFLHSQIMSNEQPCLIPRTPNVASIWMCSTDEPVRFPEVKVTMGGKVHAHPPVSGDRWVPSVPCWYGQRRYSSSPTFSDKGIGFQILVCNSFEEVTPCPMKYLCLKGHLRLEMTVIRGLCPHLFLALETVATEGGSGTVSGWTGESKAKPLLGIPWEGTVETGQTDMTGECRQFQ